MNIKLLTATAAAAFALVASIPASATTTFTLDLGEGAVGLLPGPYGTVNVNLTDSTHATIDFISATPQFYFLGVNAADVNSNGASTSSNLTSNGTATLSDGLSGNVNGWGTFNHTINQSDGFTDRSSTISFTLTNTTGTWALDSDVLAANASGYTVAAHVGYCTDNPCTAFVSTGFVTNGGTPGIPEPATWAMMILGFGGVGALMRRRRSFAPAFC
jgi:hypothetical protein